MSARGRLAELLFWSVPSADDDEARREANEFIDAFTHELAEKIREDWRQKYSRLTASIGADNAIQRALGAESGADLIDPYLSRVDSTSVADTGRDQP